MYQQKCCAPTKKCEEKKCCKRCTEGGKSILKCACGNSLSNIVAITLPTGAVQPYALGNITVDPCDMCNSTTVLTISGTSSVLVALALGTPQTINVYRNCKGIKELIKSLPFTGTLAALATDSFNYTICIPDDSCCDGCTNYSFDFVPGTTLAVAAGLAITNVVITALTVEKDC